MSLLGSFYAETQFTTFGGAEIFNAYSRKKSKLLRTFLWFGICNCNFRNYPLPTTASGYERAVGLWLFVCETANNSSNTFKKITKTEGLMK